MIQYKGPDNAPTSRTSASETRASENPAYGPAQAAAPEQQLDLQGLQVSESSALTALFNEALAPCLMTPETVAKRGARTYDTGVRITIEVLFVSA